MGLFSALMELLEKLEGEHGPLTERVSLLQALFAAVAAGERQVSAVQAELRGHLEWLRDELLDHFGREEECYFPYLRDNLPDVRQDVDRLESAHDQICGALSRMQYLTARGSRRFEEGFEHLAHVFARFAETYVTHASSEREVLREAASRLTTEQRGELAETASGVG
jgi:iron-sulfur cluster repair protein YtfE (RIC family)